MPSAIVTGSAGFIGKHLVHRLVAQGIETYCLIRPESEHLVSDKVNVIKVAEFSDALILNALKNIEVDVVFNLAAYGVNPNCHDPSMTNAVNVSALVALLKAAAHWKLKQFINIGSCAEYGDCKEGLFIDTDAPVNPLSIYAASKVAGHVMGKAIATQYNLPLTHLRIFNIYGPGEAAFRLSPYIINGLLNNTVVNLSPGLQVRDFLYIDDLIDALMLAADLPREIEVYNICSSCPESVKNMALLLAEIMQYPSKQLNFGAHPMRANETAWMVGDYSKFKNKTAWSPKYTLRQGLSEMVAILRECYV